MRTNELLVRTEDNEIKCLYNEWTYGKCTISSSAKMFNDVMPMRYTTNFITMARWSDGGEITFKKSEIRSR